MYRLDCTYDGDLFDSDCKVDKLIEKTVGKKSSGSGMGFGLRDIGFIYQDAGAAVRAFQRINRVKKPKIDVTLYNNVS